MGYKQYVWAIDQGIKFDSGTQRSIFLEICFRADSKNIIRMGQSELAIEMLYSTATIKREFVKLQMMGLIEKEGHGRYHLCMDATGKGMETDTIHGWLQIKASNNEITVDNGHKCVGITKDEVVPDCVQEAIDSEELVFSTFGQINGQSFRLFRINLI